MKNYLLLSLLFLLCFQTIAGAQAPISLKVDLATNTFTINDVAFTPASTLDEYEKQLGKYDRIEQRRGVDQYFIYDKLGISLSIENDNDIVNEIFITYQPASDQKAAKEAFKGKLTINGHVVQAETSHQELGKRLKLKFVEVMNGYFLSPKNTISFLMNYPEGTPYTKLKLFGIRL